MNAMFPLRTLWTLAIVGLLSAGAHAQTPAATAPTNVPTIFTDASPTPADTNMQHSLGLATEKARTFSVTVTHGWFPRNVNDWVAPGIFHRVVFDAQAHKARTDFQFDSAPSASEIAGKNIRPAFVIYDGTDTVEYDPINKKYLSAAFAQKMGYRAALVLNIERFVAEARGFVNNELKLDGEDTIDGHKMIVKECEAGSPLKDNPMARSVIERYYIDAETHLLRRHVELTRRPREKQYVPGSIQEYTNWVVNAPVDPGVFAWTPPAGATAYIPPVDPTLLAVGTPAPDFTCEGPDGKPLKLSDMKGKIVVLDFWATWCGPCQNSMPHLEHVYQATKGAGVTVLALCVRDLKPKYDAWRVTHKKDYTFPVAYDPAGTTGNAIDMSLYNVTGIPTQYVIGKDGKVVATNVGYNPDGSDHRLEAELATLGVTVAVPAAATKTAAR